MMIKDYKHLIELQSNPYGTNAFKVCESEMRIKLKGEVIAMYY